jgi:uncharacterized membrane protein YqjE
MTWIKQAKIILLTILIILVIAFCIWIYTYLQRQNKITTINTTQQALEFDRQAADRLLQRAIDLSQLKDELSPPPIDLNLTL